MLLLQLLHPLSNVLVGASSLGMLWLGKGKFLDAVAILVGEHNHQIGSREMSGYLIWQSVERRFIANGSLSCRNHHEEMVGGYGGSQARKFVPMLHESIVGSHGRMPVLHKLVDKGQRLLTSMKLHTALQIAGQTRQAFKPAIESRFKLGP